MRVVMLSDREWGGGAAIAAGRLAHGLAARGHQVTRLVDIEHSAVNRTWEIQSLSSRVNGSVGLRAIRKALPKATGRMWSENMASRELRRALFDLRPDVINVHNIHGAPWPSALVQICMEHAPTIWTLHDMWSFTGRCVYNNECRNFASGCGSSCPTPGEYPAVAPSRIATEWSRKSVILAGSDGPLAGVSPSAWLAREATGGLWKSRRMEVIPYGLDTSVYEPLDREVARKALGVPGTDRPLLLAAADHLNDPRKGTDLLLSALGDIGSVTLLTFGSGNPPMVPPGVRIIPLGRIDHERTKALAYNAADIYIHAARADNLPLTVMESISCGTPVAAFPVGGVPDMVRPGLTGWLASGVSAAALADTIRRAMSDVARRPLRGECRKVAETEYNLGLQAERYERLFESVRVRDAQPAGEPAHSLTSTAFSR